MAFMTKNAQTRVNDIADDIAALAPVGNQNAVRMWVNNNFATASGGNAVALKALSNELTMTNVQNAGNATDRANRRALAFLEGIKAGSNIALAKQNVANLPAGLLAARLAPLVNKAVIEADQMYGNGAVIQNIFLTQLMAQPVVFLTNHKLRSGSIAAGANCRFFYDYRTDQFKFEPNAPAQFVHAYNFAAVSVPGVFWHNVPGRTAAPAAGSFATIAGTQLTGADIMISTMFSGCSFCFKQENLSQNIYAAHIMPDDGAGHVVTGGGAGLAQQLGGQVPAVTAGNFAGTAAGNFRVYGAGWSNLAPPLNAGYPVRTAVEEFMNIVGIRTGGHWAIYSQHVLDNNKAVVQLF